MKASPIAGLAREEEGGTGQPSKASWPARPGEDGGASRGRAPTTAGPATSSLTARRGALRRADERGGGRRVVGETPARDGAPRPEVGEAAEVPRFDDATAAPYVGWYDGDELDAVYGVALGERGLELRHARHGAMPLVPRGMGDAFGVNGQAVVGVTFSRGSQSVP